MKKTAVLASLASLIVLGCSGGSDAAADDKAGIAKSADASSCADDGGRLALTNLCEGRSVNYLNMETSTSPEADDGCEWKVMETQVVEDVLLYRGLKCGERETKLEFSGGAERAELRLVSSAFSGKIDDAAIDETSPMVYIYTIEGDALKGVTERAISAIETKAEAAGCGAKFAKLDYWPSDAIVVDIPAAQAAKEADDGPRTACGPLGLDQDSTAFWRVGQGFGYYFNMGQDAFEIDPGSFTMMTKGPDGNWGPL